MAIDVQVLGPQRLYINAPGTQFSGNGAPNTGSQTWAWTVLGTTEDGVDVRWITRSEEVYCDEFGGRGGVPVDVLHKGLMAKISFVLVRYDPVVAENILSGLRRNNTQNIPLPGTRMFADGMGFSLLMYSRNPSDGGTAYKCFEYCYITDDRTISIGTKASKIAMSMTAVTNYTKDIVGFFQGSYPGINRGDGGRLGTQG